MTEYHKSLPRNIEDRKSFVVKVRACVSVTKIGPPSEDPQIDFSYEDSMPIARGTFGIVFKATVRGTGETIAIKKVALDPRFKNRELDITRLANHQNLIKLHYYFYTHGPLKRDEVFLGMVFDYYPDTMESYISERKRADAPFPKLELKAYFYQLLRGLGYLHSFGVSHRDTKPQNILIDPTSRLLKICDFGSAKALTFAKTSTNYICSRYYRAPELLFNCFYYDVKIDIWSAACVFAEMIVLRPFFDGHNSTDQLIQIMRTLGKPTMEDAHAMNTEIDVTGMPEIKRVLWSDKLEGKAASDEILVLQTMLKYSIMDRPSAYEAMALPFFNELRVKGNKFSDGDDFPPLLNFTGHELAAMKSDLAKILNPERDEKVVPTELPASGADK